MNLLYLGYVPKGHVYSNDFWFFDELGKQANVTFVNLVDQKTKEIDRKIEKIIASNKIDAVYKNFMKGDFNSLYMKPLSRFGLPTIISSGDCHTRLTDGRYKALVEYHNFSAVMVNNQSVVKHFKKYFNNAIAYIWVPWAYNPSVHRDYGLAKKWQTTIPAGNFVIPIRRKIRDKLVESEINHLDVWFHRRKRGYSPKKYSRLINQCEIAISTCQQDELQFYENDFIGMTFTKYFEVPMCNSLHVSQRSADCELLGFRDGKNVVLFDTVEECLDKVRYYLDRKREAERIISASIEHVKDRHAIKARVSKFLEDISAL